jgi:exopolysaccharide production protein ExoY
LVWTERCAAGAALIALSPILAGVTVAVRFLSGKSPLVAHQRAGLGGEPFWLLKFRTMWDGGPAEGRARCSQSWVEYLENTELPVIKRGPDPRVTSSFAAFCRRFSIDELPQLIHVVSGKMRLVGPRPLTPLEMDVYYGDAAPEVLSVPPGITGLWQVMGRNSLSYPQRRRLDKFYVRRFCLKLYWFVLLRTPWCVLRGRDVW